MNITKLRIALASTLLSIASSAVAATEYTEDFTVEGSQPFSDIGWNAYLLTDSGNVNDLSSSGSGIAEAYHTDYGYIRTFNNPDYSVADGPGLMFTTEPTSALISTSITDISKLSVGIRADGSPGDPALARFAIQIGTQWYASDISATSTSQPGPPSSSNLPGEFTTFETAALFDFSNGSNWREMTVTTGASGEISIAGSVVGGTLSGDITAFGVYAKNGNNGDHFRIDNFTVIVPEPSTFILPAIIGLGMILSRRISQY